VLGTYRIEYIDGRTGKQLEERMDALGCNALELAGDFVTFGFA